MPKQVLVSYFLRKWASCVAARHNKPAPLYSNFASYPVSLHFHFFYMRHGDAIDSPSWYRLALNSCKDTLASSQTSQSRYNLTVATVANFSQISLTQTDAVLVDSSMYHQ